MTLASKYRPREGGETVSELTYVTKRKFSTGNLACESKKQERDVNFLFTMRYKTAVWGPSR